MKQQQFWMDRAVAGLSFVWLGPVASFTLFAVITLCLSVSNPFVIGDDPSLVTHPPGILLA